MSPTYTLYYSPGTLSASIHWLLIHVGASYTLVEVDVTASATHTPAYLAINPKGKVPALGIAAADGSTTVYTEAVALAQVLAERHPEHGLWPPPGDALRPKALELAAYIASAFLGASRDWQHAFKDPVDPETDGPAVRRLATRRLQACFAFLDDEIDARGGPFLLGARPCVLDFIVTSVFPWPSSRACGVFETRKLKRLAQHMTKLDSWRTVLEKEGLTAKMKDWPSP